MTSLYRIARLHAELLPDKIFLEWAEDLLGVKSTGIFMLQQI